MDREELLNECINEYIIENSINDYEKVYNYIEENMYEVNKDILWKFEQIFRKTLAMQNEGKKGSISLITISFLNSSFINNKVEVLINLYDENGFKDNVIIEDTYSNSFINDVLKNDIENFKKYIRTKIIRVAYSESYKYTYKIMNKYRELYKGIFTAFINNIVMLETFSKIKINEDFKITFGEFYCKGIVIYENETQEI